MARAKIYAPNHRDDPFGVNGSDSVSAARAIAIEACGDAGRVAVDPVVRTIAGIDARGHLRTWDARSGRCLLVHAFDLRGAIALAFDASGDRLALLLSDGTLVIFERRVRKNLVWLQPMRSYSGPDYDGYLATVSFGSNEQHIVVITPADAMGQGAVRIVVIHAATSSDSDPGDAEDVTREGSVEAEVPEVSQPVRLMIDIAGGQTIVVSCNAAAGTGRISGPGLTAFWNDTGIERFEFDFVSGNVRFLGVRAAEPWTLLGMSTLQALGRDGWYALAAALGACYNGKVTAFERDVSFP